MRTERRIPSRWLALALLAMLLASATANAAESLEEARDRAREANRAYEDGDYPAAVEAYRGALELGLEHPTVFYNLGNAYYKNGDLGRAIHAYLRAERRAPRDGAISRNLSRARSQMEDQEISSHTVPTVLRPVTGLRDFFSLDEWSRLLVLLFTLSCAVAVVGHWRSGGRQWRRRILVGTLALTVLSAGMLTARYYGERVVERAVVVEPEVEVRSGPGRDYDLAFRIHAGLLVDVAERRDEWVRVDLGGELVGWVPADRLRSL